MGCCRRPRGVRPVLPESRAQASRTVAGRDGLERDDGAVVSGAASSRPTRKRLRDSMRVGVEVEGAAAYEASESEAVVAREVDGQRGRRRHRHEHRDTRKHRLLHELERRAAAHAQDVLRQGQRAPQQHPSHHLVHGVVAPDVLGDLDERAVEGEHSGRVQATRAVEDRLARPQSLWQARHDGGGYGPVCRDGGRIGLQGVDGLAAADAAGRRGRDLAPFGESRAESIDRRSLERDVDGGLVVGLSHRGDLVGAAHDLFGQEEPRREIAVVAGGPHRDREGLPVEANLEGRLGGGAVLGGHALAVADALHLDGSPGSRHGTDLIGDRVREMA